MAASEDVDGAGAENRPNSDRSAPSRVLLVDDSRLMRRGLRRALGKVVLDVHEANNGREALSLIRQRPFDLVITDLQMPVMDGFELIDTMRRNAETRRVPVIAVTAASKEDRRRALDIGAGMVLQKGTFEASAFAQLVHSIVKRCSARGEAPPRVTAPSQPVRK